MDDHPGARLASRLRELREREWPELTVTQAQLAIALSDQRKVGSAAVSTWENVGNPKAPTVERLSAYARFFASRRSMDGRPHLLADGDFADEERERFEHLEHELLQLHESPVDDAVVDGRLLLSFEDDTGPVAIVCPEAPKEARGPLADDSDPNYTRMHRFADADALIEVFGHIRSLNPERHVHRRLPSETGNADLSNHLVMIGGIGWNATLRRVHRQLRNQLPVEQFEHESLGTGEVFRIRDSGREYLPVVEEYDGVRQLTEDVGLIARLRNPFNITKTLTIFNGVHSTGVLGAIRAITDETVRGDNQVYLAERFARGGDFAMLIRVFVNDREPLAPALRDPDVRLYEWPSAPGEGVADA